MITGDSTENYIWFKKYIQVKRKKYDHHNLWLENYKGTEQSLETIGAICKLSYYYVVPIKRKWKPWSTIEICDGKNDISVMQWRNMFDAYVMKYNTVIFM